MSDSESADSIIEHKRARTSYKEEAFERFSVIRTEEISRLREKLPAVMMEQEIVEAVRSHDVVLIAGDTGCGKSTQVPQFLLEAGFAVICVTQPRRVAAISVSERVGEELNDRKLVGFQVRYEKGSLSNKTKIKFQTDGILLREIQADLLLPQYKVVIIDEAHERSVNCDILLGLLSRAVRVRRSKGNPLKVVIMSATLRLTDFTENRQLFPKKSYRPPVIQISARTHPVTIHYELSTPADYLEAAKAKVLEIHRKLPAGSILVFLTGRHEVDWMVEELRSEQLTEKKSGVREQKRLHALLRGSSAVDSDNDEEVLENLHPTENQIDLEFSTLTSPTDQVRADFNLGIEGEISNMILRNGKAERGDEVPVTAGSCGFLGKGEGGKMRVLPLYAQLGAEAQRETFEKKIPDDSRVIVIATNVAETALTLPNVRYVVDCGMEKRREIIGGGGGVSRFRVSLCSQASADQRAGRAGRVGPGHCYRLFTPAVFGNFMAPYPPAEILTTPFDQPLLFLASLGVPRVLEFPWPTAPEKLSVRLAFDRLQNLGILTDSGVITDFGKKAALLPLSPRYALILLRAVQRTKKIGWELLAQACACVAAMTVGDLLNDHQSGKAGWMFCESDIDSLVWAVSAFMWSSDQQEFCNSQHVNSKSAEEAAALTKQLYGLVTKRLGLKVSVGSERPVPPNAAQKIALRECVVEGLIDRLAVKSEEDNRDFMTSEKVIARIHPNSRSATSRPEIIAYSDIVVNASGKSVMRCVVPVDPVHLSRIASPLIDRGQALKFPPPKRMHNGSLIGFFKPVYKALDYTLPTCELIIE